MSEPLAAATDQELLARVRGGEAGAYGELWRRHSGAVTAILRLETRLDADDLTAEVFTRILATIRAGNGPDTAFRPYALVAARNLAAEWGRRGRREIAVADDSLDAESNEPPVDESVAVLPHRHVAARVFSSLPVRWQEVLWYLEVEQLSAAEAAPLVGLNANSTVQLAFRAREGFRQAWIQEHLHGRPAGTRDCAWVDRRVGRYVRGKLASIERGRLERHTSACERCSTLIDEGRSIEGRAIFVLLPALLLGGAASGYLAAAERGETRRSEPETAAGTARPVRFAKGGGRTRSARVAALVAAGAAAATIAAAVVGVVLAQSSTVPVQAAQAAEVGGIGAEPPGPAPTPRAPTLEGVREDRAPGVETPVGEAPDAPSASPESGAAPVAPADEPVSATAAVSSAGMRANGLAFPSVTGYGIPGATIEVVVDPDGVAMPFSVTADAAGYFDVLVGASSLVGTQWAVVRQVVDGVASGWTAPFKVVIPDPPQAIWLWATPGKLELKTMAVEPYALIEVRIDGVSAGFLVTSAASGETFYFTIASPAPLVEVRYEDGGLLAPMTVVPQY